MEDGLLAAGDMTDMCADLFDHIEDFLEFPNDEDLIAAVDHCPPPPPPPTLPLQHQHQHHMPPPSASSSSSSSSSSQIMMMIPTPVAAAAAPAPASAPPPLTATATAMHDIIFLGGDSTITAATPEHGDLDIAQLEWLSNFFDDSSSDPFSQDLANNSMHMNMNMNMNMSVSMSMNNNSKSDENGFNGIIRSGKDALFRTCGSPVSVLEPNSLVGLSNNCSAKTTTSSSSSSSSGVGSTSNERLLAPPHSPPEAMVSAIPARARTKRPRAVSSSRPLISVSFSPPPPPPPPPPPAAAAVSEAEADSFGESDSSPSMATTPVPVMMMMQKKKKKQQQKTKKRKSPGAAAIAAGEEEGGEAEGEGEGAGPPPARKCMHCEIQKTPQWRAGPMGPKTLCNACGVRYKSGRLFPEYRPAASPTFIPTLHSNSHKKVVEMRIKASQKTATVADKESPALKNCDLIEYIRRRD
ncbi:putative transcription factor C2C2-GATA family [Dioscorea sansibarensis]